MAGFNYSQYKYDHYSQHSPIPFDIGTLENSGPGECVHPHWHNQMEIIYVRKGSCTVLVSGRSYSVPAGAVIPVMPGELHSIYCIDKCLLRLEIYCFPLGIIESRTPDVWLTKNIIQPIKCRTFQMPRPILPGTPLHGLVRGPLESASLAMQHMYPAYTMAVKSSLFAVLGALYTGQENKKGSSSKESENAAELEIMLDYITEHYSERINLEDAATACGYSTCYFSHKFKEVTGDTFVNYLNNYRLERAACLLENKNETADGAARLCGFDNYERFSLLFKEKYGVTPITFRKNHLKSKQKKV